MAPPKPLCMTGSNTYHQVFATPVLRVRRVGNSLGIVLPRAYVQTKGLAEGDEVRVEVEPVLTLDQVAGRLRRYNLSVDAWNDATNEGEEL